MIDLSQFLVEEEPWKGLANCLGMGTEPFFPERGDSVTEGKRICFGCVVREECLEYGMRTRSSGMWGGVILDHGKPKKRKAASAIQDGRPVKIASSSARRKVPVASTIAARKSL